MTSLLHRTPDHANGLLDWISNGSPIDWFGSRSFIPVEESTHDGIYELRADIPGVDPDRDISITISGDLLTIEAERHEETRSQGHGELRYGTFSRTVRMPSARSGRDVTAKYTDGVLTVTVPVEADATEPTRIPVSRGDVAATN